MSDYQRMRFLGHLPSLVFPADVSSAPVLEGRIRALDVEEWREFDDSYPFQDRRYEANRPLFLEIEGEFPGDLIDDFKEGSDWLSRRLTQLHNAWTVVTAGVLPNPLFSMRCLMIGEPEDEIGGSVIRKLGDMTRELLVFGSDYPPIVISEPVLEDVRLTLSDLEVATGTPVDDVVAALVRCARPGFSPLNQMLHLTISLDHLLVAAEDYANKEATRAYAQRLACCLAGPEESPGQYEHLAQVMYRVRSSLVHGRATDLDFESEELRWLVPRSRAIAAYVARLASAWLAHNETDLEGLRTTMNTAFLDVEVRASLHAAINTRGHD